MWLIDRKIKGKIAKLSKVQRCDKILLLISLCYRQQSSLETLLKILKSAAMLVMTEISIVLILNLILLQQNRIHFL